MAIETAADVFEEYRPVLMGVAYRMLGRVTDAEDVVRDTWLRWSGSDRRETREPHAYLVRITTRLAIDRLRLVQSRKQAYVGPWLPEPLVTDFGDSATESAEAAALADSVSLGVLLALESLSPVERAVYVLREAFGFPRADIAAALDRTESAVRQLAGRAQRQVAQRRPRYDVDPVLRRLTTERFAAAATHGDVRGLRALLAPGVRLIGDSGARGRAPVRVLHSPDRVAPFVLGITAREGTFARSGPPPRARVVELNGAPAVVFRQEGATDSALQLDLVDGLVDCVYVMRNPEKLLSPAAVGGRTRYRSASVLPR